MRRAGFLPGVLQMVLHNFCQTNVRALLVAGHNKWRIIVRICLRCGSHLAIIPRIPSRSGQKTKPCEKIFALFGLNKVTSLSAQHGLTGLCDRDVRTSVHTPRLCLLGTSISRGLTSRLDIPLPRSTLPASGYRLVFGAGKLDKEVSLLVMRA